MYLSLLGHPLNEAFPVTLPPGLNPIKSNYDQQHLNTEQVLFWVSETLPFCVVYEPERRVARLCLICRAQQRSRQPLNAA